MASFADAAGQTIDTVSCPDAFIDLALAGTLQSLAGRVNDAACECSRLMGRPAPEPLGDLTDPAYLDFGPTPDWTDTMDSLGKHVRDCGGRLTFGIEMASYDLVEEFDTYVDVDVFNRYDRWFPNAHPPESGKFAALATEAWQLIYSAFRTTRPVLEHLPPGVTDSVAPSGGSRLSKNKRRKQRKELPALWLRG